MTNMRYWLALSLVAAILATTMAQSTHVTGTTTHDSDETNESKLRKNDFSDLQIRDGKQSDNQINSRTGRQLSLFGQSPYDHNLGINRFGSSNLLGATNTLGSSSILGSGGLTGFNTAGYPDAYGSYQSFNPLGTEVGSQLNPFTGSYSPYGFGNNPYYNNAQLLGNRLGANYLTSGSFGTGLLSNGLLSSQLGNGLFSTNHQLSNQLLSNSQLYNSLRNQYDGYQRFGNQVLSPDGVARTIVHDSRNDGYGKYSYQFKTDNGITQQQRGQLVGPDNYAVTGSYSYTSPEGELVTVKYVADENGFQVQSPNLPPIPEHSRLQLLAAQEARRLGLIDSNGNPTGLRSNTDNSRFRNTNLGATGVGLNRNTGLGSRSGLLNNDYRTSGLQNLNSLDNGYRSGNILQTSVLNRPYLGSLNTRTDGIYNQGLLDSRNPNSQSVILSRIGAPFQDSDEYSGSFQTNRDRGFNRPPPLTGLNLGTTAFSGQYPQLAASSRSLRLPEEYLDGRYSLFSADSDFNRRYFNADSYPNFNTRTSSFQNPYSVEQLPRFERLRSSNARALGSPFFQPLTASRFGIQDGRSRRFFLRQRDFRGKPADIALASNRESPISNNVASYIYRS